MVESPEYSSPKMVFNPPPNWHLEPGFVPSGDWRPDPAWGPAPAGWSFWLPEAPAVNLGQAPRVAAPAVPKAPVAEPQAKKRRTALIAVIIAAVVVLLVIVSVTQGQRKAAEELVAARQGYEASVSGLNTAIAVAEEVLANSEGAVLEESSRDALEAEITRASEIAAEPVDQEETRALVSHTSSVDQARTQLTTATGTVKDSISALSETTQAREKTAAKLVGAREAVQAAEQVLAGSEGKVNNADLRTQLAASIEEVRTHAETDPSALGLGELNTLEDNLRRSIQRMVSAAGKVTADQDEWQKVTDKAAAAAALRDPASYPSISSRDWQFVERDPAAYKDQKYVIYGRVTQFDSNTGANVFRADTDGQMQSGMYDYDINTMVLGESAVLANVVQGDLVKLYVTVVGPYSYETTMGAQLTVPMVTAHIIEVYGSA